MDEDAATTKATPLDLLVQLQDHDAHVDRLRYRRGHLDERVRLGALDSELGRCVAVIANLEAERAVLKAREADLEAEITAVRGRRVAIDERLSSSEAGSFRDQEVMATELGSLTERAADLEDVELEVLESLEPLENELASLHGERGRLEQERVSLVDELRRAEEAVDAEIATALEERSPLAHALPEDLASEYERLRARLDGVGAARLEHGACSGCHLSIPATDLDRMRKAVPGTLFHCEQCGRILVPS